MEEYVAKSILKKELNISNLHSGIIDALQNIVDEIPAADVQEVKHGHWIECGVYRFKCSRCGIIEAFESPYCRECGAKMNDKENNE